MNKFILKTHRANDTSSLKRIQLFVNSHPNNNFFQSIHAFNIFYEAKNHKPIYFTVEENDALLGVLLVVVLKNGQNIKGFLSRRCIIIGGPLVNNNEEKLIDLLLDKLNSHIKKRAIYSQFRNDKVISDKLNQLFTKKGYVHTPHLNIIHDLSLSIGEQWEKIHKGRRKNINRAIRKGVIFRKAAGKQEFDKAYGLIKNTYRRIGLPLADKSLFEACYSQLTDQGIFNTFVADYEGEIISTRMVLCYNNTVYDWYAGSDDANLDKYPNDFMPWKVIEWGTQNGYEIFDFGGAGQPDKEYGVRDFKLKFGGQLFQNDRFEKVNNSLLFNIGKTAINITKGLRTWFI